AWRGSFVTRYWAAPAALYELPIATVPNPVDDTATCYRWNGNLGRSSKALRPVQPAKTIDEDAAHGDFPVQVGAGRKPGVAHEADRLALRHSIAFLDEDLAHMA